MSQSYSKKYTMPHLNGFAAAAVLVVAALFIAWRGGVAAHGPGAGRAQRPPCARGSAPKALRDH